jgi:hypothetical protein
MRGKIQKLAANTTVHELPCLRPFANGAQNFGSLINAKKNETADENDHKSETTRQ